MALDQVGEGVRLYPDAVTRYLTDPTSGLNTDASRKAYQKTLRALQLTQPDKKVADFTEDDLVNFVGRPGLAPASIAGYRARIHGFFSWAQWRGLRPDDPSANLKRLTPGSLTKPVRRHHWLTSSEVGRILDQVDTSTPIGLRTLVVLRLGFTMGLRRDEIARLTWDQIDLTRQSITFTGKGRKLASLYITDATLPWLDKWRSEALTGHGGHAIPAGAPVVIRFQSRTDFKSGWALTPDWARGVTGDTIGDIVDRAARDAGVEFAAHDMRRSFANMLEEKGASIEEISAALRHSNLGTTQRYLERRQDAGFNAVKKRGLDV